VLNKIDLPQAEPEAGHGRIEERHEYDATDAVVCSARAGWALRCSWSVFQHSAPLGELDAPLQAVDHRSLV